MIIVPRAGPGCLPKANEAGRRLSSIPNAGPWSEGVLKMAEEPKRSISEMIDDDELMTEAIRQGVRKELLSHARAGNSVPVSDNGQIVWLSPDEIYKRLGYTAPTGNKAS